jgi:DNA-binding LacI/PurR family transcriptional regulator
VCIDDFHGSHEGTLYFIKIGHRKIAYIEYKRSDLPSVLSDRVVGLKKAIDEYGLSFPPGNRIPIDLYNMEELQKS